MSAGAKAIAVLRALLTSKGSAVVLLLVLFLLTWLGTLYQVEHGLHAAQQRYFDSWFLVQPIWGPLAIPLPGGYLAMLLLCINLVAGGLVAMRWTKAKAGVIIVHLGIVLMLVAGFVKFHFATEGYLRLYEGEQAGEYADHYAWEVAISRRQSDGTISEYLVPQDFFRELGPDQWRRFEHPDLPLAIELSRFLVNCSPLQKGPMFEAPTPVVDGFFLRPEERRAEAEANLAGLYARVAGEPDRAGLLWGPDIPPWTIPLDDGPPVAVSLRHKRYPLPFTVRLDDFHHEFHPGTRMARVYRSDVTVIDGADERGQRIEMNEPLRRDGVIAFQASYGPPDAGPGARMYSVFAVVQNPSDQWPLISCIVIAIGLVWHFGAALMAYVRREAKRTREDQP